MNIKAFLQNIWQVIQAIVLLLLIFLVWAILMTIIVGIMIAPALFVIKYFNIL